MKIEKDEIIIRKAIVHILDCERGFIRMSDTLLDLGPGLNEFLRGHIFRLIDSDDTKHCRLNGSSEVHNLLMNLNERDEEQFIETSQVLAERLFDIMCESIEIPSADVIAVSFQVESQVYMALLKMNYKDSYVHYETNTKQNDIVLQRVIPPVTTRLTEAMTINLGTMEIRLAEKKYEIRDEKVNYLSERFLMCYTDLAPKRKFNILTRIINDINNKYDMADAKKKMETKSRLLKMYEESGEFRVVDIGEKLFGDNVEKKEAFDMILERYDMQYDKFSVQKEATVKKLLSLDLYTDTGIEIKIPMKEYDTKDNIQITKEPDGTSTVVIKNVENINVR